MIAVLAAIGLSLDGGQQLDRRRGMQAAADATALAAVSELYANWWLTTPRGSDTGQAHASALGYAVAAKNGYINGVNGCTVDVNIPPESGPFSGQYGHAEVLITASQERYFSRVFANDSVQIGSRAVARGKRATVEYGILVLDPDDSGALTVMGNGTTTVTGGADVVVNSNSSTAMVAGGNGSVSVADGGEYQVVGIPGVSDPSKFAGTINSGRDPVPDPLRFLPPPDPGSLPIRNNGKAYKLSSAKIDTLQPGVYVGGISVVGKGGLILETGIYYMQGGGFSFAGQGSLTGDGVMIYNAPTKNSDTVELTGQGNVRLSPLLTGPFAGITLFQDRNSDNTVKVTGSLDVDFIVSGAFYAAGADLQVTGNGNAQAIGGQYISKTVKLGGNGTFSVNWDPPTIPGIREIYLVE
jgi:hypothetical protein